MRDAIGAGGPDAPIYLKFLAGAITGGVGSVFGNPFDVLKSELEFCLFILGCYSLCGVCHFEIGNVPLTLLSFFPVSPFQQQFRKPVRRNRKA